MVEIKVGLIYGSVREGRLCDRVAEWAAQRIAAGGPFLVDAIDPKQIMLACWPDPIGHADLEGLRGRIARADAFVIVTPEYNHGYPGALKLVIDSASREWRAKPVAYVSYGGISGGLRAVEQLRLVFSELHVVSVRDSVSLSHASNRFDSSGNLNDAPEAERAMTAMLARLQWWARALSEARKATPYETVVA